MRKTIPKFVITAVAFLALPRVYGMEPSQYLNQLAKQKDCSAVKDLLNRRVHTSTRNAIETTLMKENTEEGQEAVIPNNFPNELIPIITDYTVAPTVYEIANKIQKKAYGPPIEFNIDPSLASRLLVLMARRGKTELVRMLLHDKADANARNDWKDPALFSAASKGHAGCVSLLLQAKADVNAMSVSCWTPLQTAALQGRTECVSLLLQANADVNLAYSRLTPLILAASRGRTECVSLLLQANADVNLTSTQGTALFAAERFEHEDTATVIRTWIPPEEENSDNSVIV